MNNKVTIFHNPRCSKSRATLELLNEKNIKTTIVSYLETPPDREELETILKMLSLQPRQLMRTGEAIYKELDLKEENEDSKLIDAMIKNPILIERPIVISGNKAAIGRPLENILEII